MAMEGDFPKYTDFDENDITVYERNWDFQRDAGLSGENKGEDFLLPDGMALVDYEVHEGSRYNTKGDPDIRFVFDESGMLRMPIGLHNGIRLTPGEYTQGGASYTGKFIMRGVSESKWKAFIVSKL